MLLPLLLLPRPHGILVHGGVGLSRGVVAWRQAVARLAAVVAVPVVHGAVLVVQGYDKETFNKLRCYRKHLFKGFNILQSRQICQEVRADDADDDAAPLRERGKGHALVFTLKPLKMHLCACPCTH